MAIIDTLIAGIDTTSSAIKGLLYFLAKNPDKQSKLRHEVLQMDTITPDSVTNLSYLRACMKEAQRIQPTAPGNIRKSGANLVLQGYQVPKGTLVYLNHSAVSKMEQHFGRSDEFIPERWLKDESHAKEVGCPHSKMSNPFTYMPFGFGARTCIGKRLAELEVMVLTAHMVKEFEMSWVGPEPKIVSHQLRTMAGDYALKLVDVK